jgi:hypothetical protein
MKNKTVDQFSVVKESFKAFAFRYHSRFCLQPVEKRNNILKMYDNFDYTEDDQNMPFKGSLKQNEVHIVAVKVYIKDYYTISESIIRFYINNFNKRIGLGELKSVLNECYEKYFDQKYKDSIEKIKKDFPF